MQSLTESIKRQNSEHNTNLHTLLSSIFTSSNTYFAHHSELIDLNRPFICKSRYLSQCEDFNVLIVIVLLS